MAAKKEYDVIIIGCGIVGLFIAYKLSRFNLEVLVLEKEPEIGLGVSKGHAAVIHVIQLPFDSLKSRLARRGNKIYDKICCELNIRLRRLYTLILATNLQQYLLIPFVYLYLKLKLGSDFTVKPVFTRKGILRYERNIGEKVLGGIVVGGYGVVDAFDLMYSLYRFALRNGVEFKFASEVKNIKIETERVKVSTNGESYIGRYVINAAGLQGAKLASLLGEEVKYEYGKGAMIIFSEKVSENILTILSIKTDPRTKGGSITPTVDGKSLWGPNLVEVESEHEATVEEEDVNIILEKFSHLVKTQPSNIVKVYSGVRPLTPGNDFIIRYSKESNRVINVIGICSPGLTAAPAIADVVAEMLMNVGLKLREKKIVYPTKPIYTKNILEKGKIAEGDYIVCPCSLVSRLDVKKAVDDGASTLQGLFFRTKLGFDECYLTLGTWRALKCLAEELGVTPDNITLKGGESWIVKKY